MEESNPSEAAENKSAIPLPESGEPQVQVRSLRELIDLVTGRNLKDAYAQEDAGLAENLPFPFLAVVGQKEMKLALLLALINPNVGGVLLIGPRGTGKTTAVRSLLKLLPEIRRSACFYGCVEEDIETGGIDAVCPDCARKFGRGEPLTHPDRVRLVELPLNAKLEDVIGGLDERALVHERLRLKRGLLSEADQNILFIDEVNLLADEIVNATLDAASQGSYTVSRGPTSATYKSRFTLIGSMNPEEGNLRPQILDRFGLRVVVQGLTDPTERLEVYRRVRTYQKNPRLLLSQFEAETEIALEEIQAARRRLQDVELSDKIAAISIDLIRKYGIDSLRAEITLLESARAYAAADGRTTVDLGDIRIVAPMALRLRRSAFMARYIEERSEEDKELEIAIDAIGQFEK
ncbi:MAG TPA: ATP-binding protein [Anaerolineaceae bacterium]|nr:ATP-binding protein [Anaerolineaceae bacterium]